jgi:myo-inositol 2-dehydrogenase/D-chiro-inositol 1-dehydrogenase
LAVDTDLQRAREAAARWGAGQAGYATDYHEALAHPGVDAVVVATPPEVTPRIAIAALHAGKHVLSEKPMAVTLAEAANVRTAVRSSGRVYQIGFILRYYPLYRRLKALAPRVGTPRSVRIAVVEEAYNPSDTEHLARIGGTLAAVSAMAHDGAHLADMLLWLAEGETARTVGAWTLRSRPEFAGPNHWIGAAGLSGGSAGQVEVAWLYPGDLRAEVTIMGPHGVVRGATVAAREDAPHRATLSAQWEDGTWHEEEFPAAAPDFAAQLGGFLDHIGAGTPPVPGVEEALRSLTLTCAFEEAGRTGQVVEVAAMHE